MPDNISMCNSETCPARERCYRNMASGTQPSEWRQAWMDFGRKGEPCDSFWHVSVADDLSERLKWAADRIEQLEAKLADVIVHRDAYCERAKKAEAALARNSRNSGDK